MYSENAIKEMLRQYLSERTPLSIECFCEKACYLFEGWEGVDITPEAIAELVSGGYLQLTEANLLSPEELLKLNPITLITVETFAQETGLSTSEVSELIQSGLVKSLNLSCTLISRDELRRYWREHDLQVIHSLDDLFKMLDTYFRDSASWWDNFFADRTKRIPFFLEVPDENLVEYLIQPKLKPTKVLELGCGNGRNALYMAEQGIKVDAVDIAEKAIAWGKEMATQRNVQVNFLCQSIFDLQIDEGTYDFVYDSGCFHHIWPHRRFTYLDLVTKALKPGGYLGMTCFKHDSNGASGPEFSDWEIYEKRMTGGGMAFSRQQLEKIFCGKFQIVDFRQMQEIIQPAEVYGKDFLWTVLFRKF